MKKPLLILKIFFLVTLTSSVQAEQLTLPQVVHKTLEWYFAGKSLNELSKNTQVPSPYNRSGGLFVTLTKNGKTRACWGSIVPQEKDLVKATISSTYNALTKEYRYPPIEKSEIAYLKAQVTLVTNLRSIKSERELNPIRDGLLVRAGAKTGVILPGEATDAHYQLVQAKLKAGIRPGEPYQMYRIKTHVIHE